MIFWQQTIERWSGPMRFQYAKNVSLLLLYLNPLKACVPKLLWNVENHLQLYLNHSESVLLGAVFIHATLNQQHLSQFVLSEKLEQANIWYFSLGNNRSIINDAAERQISVDYVELGHSLHSSPLCWVQGGFIYIYILLLCELMTECSCLLL